MIRACLPGELYLDAAVLDPTRQLRQWIASVDHDADESVPRQLLRARALPRLARTRSSLLLERSGAIEAVHAKPYLPDVSLDGPPRVSVTPPDDHLIERVRQHPPHVALRWVLNPALGIPIEPFTVWRRHRKQREQPTPIAWTHADDGSVRWDDLTEMMLLEIDVDAAGPVTILGRSHHQTNGAVAVASAPAGVSTVELQGDGPMLGFTVVGVATINAVRGVSVVTMANGDGWEPLERVGIPFDPADLTSVYYDGDQQGPVSALTDPRSAAVQRMERWGPVLGWMQLAGLQPWAAPDPWGYLDELRQGLLPGLLDVLAASPPPLLDEQQRHEVKQSLGFLEKGSLTTSLNTGDTAYESRAKIRPLTVLSTGAASDVWASLALGFGTGVELGDRDRDGDESSDDFMVTAPWRGMVSTSTDISSPFPGVPGQTIEVKIELERELAAVVLAPRPRAAPGAPTPITAELAHPEGADSLDGPYRASAKLTSPRQQVVPGHARASAYAVARFSPSGGADYVMREHPVALGWIPMAPATPVRPPGTPAIGPTPVTFRDNGVPLPLTPPSRTYAYACAASDLFGQWGPWGSTSMVASPAAIAGPGVAAVRAVARPGTSGGDPCVLEVSVELSWEWTDRSLREIDVHIDVLDTPAPPAAIPSPSPTPTTSGAATATLLFNAAGVASTTTPGVTVQAMSEDGKTLYPVGQADPTPTEVRRFRVVHSGIAVTYGAALEKAVAVYASAVDGVRTTEQGPWVGGREVAVAPNPIPPTTPVLPPVLPQWASLPDAAGISRVALTWNHTGAWAYRVYEATEAALRAVCGEPGPVLTDRLSTRVQSLFDLYRVVGNRERLKSCYRKVNDDPIVATSAVGSAMTYEIELPRGSSLIHCFVVVGVSPSNVVSGWPEPDVNGREAFLPYVIPSLQRPVAPEVLARRKTGGTVAVDITCSGPVPVTQLRVYRAANARLARHTGTMQLLATSPGPTGSHPDWSFTVQAGGILSATFVDAAPVPSWDNAQYRVVAGATDDLERAGLVAASPPSKPSAVLIPPSMPPLLNVTANAPGSMPTVGVVRIESDARRDASDAGSFVISTTSRPADTATPPAPVEPVRHSMALSRLERFPSIAAFLASSAELGVVTDGATAPVLLRVDRQAGESHSLVVTVADPVGRQSRWSGTVPGMVPDPLPVLGNLQLQRSGGVVTAAWDANTPDPADPARPWVVAVAVRPSWWWLTAPQSAQLAMTDVPVVPDAGSMPSPAANPAMKWAIAQIDATAPRQLLFWRRVTQPVEVDITVTNGDGVSTTISGGPL